MERTAFVQSRIAREVEIWMVDHRRHCDVPEVLPAEPGHTVYVIRDIHGDALYAGVTSTLWRRLGQHAERSPWWPDAHTIAVHGAKSRRAADRIEHAAIIRLQPRYNVRGVVI